jgi:ATP-dependent DNA helicase DinG
MDVAAALSRVTAALPGGGEARPGQREMAEAVGRAVDGRRHLVVQAGTGTGKSLAYLVPAIVSGAKTVVATATKALQDQLAGKDLPFLAEHLGVPFEFSVLKGRSNYLCVQKAAELGETKDDNTLELDDALVHSEVEELKRVLRWASTSESGDRAELAFEPTPRVWSALSVGSQECPGAAKCPRGDVCFAERARRRADDADVVVVNTHLYGVHLASGGWVLPEHDLVVFDEAHELEDVAAATLGLEMSAGRFRSLARVLRGLLTDPADAAPLDDAGLKLEAAIEPHRGNRIDPAADDALQRALAIAGERASKALSTVRSLDIKDGGKGHAKKQRAMKAAASLVDDVAAAASPDDGTVAWVEGPAHAPILKIATVDVGRILAPALFADRPTVLTSATIPPRAAIRLGIAEGTYDELDVGSPFEYRSHALLYVAAHLPDPRNPAYEKASHDELERLVRAAGGRTLALFTSWRALRSAAEALQQRDLPFRLLTQDDLPKPALVKAFTDDETSCLLATMGFWQGVDVPGRSLSLVVLDKIPFPRPDEPLTQARRERAGEAAFSVVDLPRAATLLAQGAGRLIRTADDRGVVAVLDPRLATKAYRRDLLAPMPPMKRTVTFGEVAAFLAEATTATTSAAPDQARAVSPEPTSSSNTLR